MNGRNFFNFRAPARSAATTRQRRGGLQGGSPPFFGFEAKLVHFQSLFFLNFVYISWIKTKSKTTIF